LAGNLENGKLTLYEKDTKVKIVRVRLLKNLIMKVRKLMEFGRT
jgi:hypothetical protein